LIDAFAAVLLLHVPPETLGTSVVLLPGQSDNVPVIAPGGEVMVTVVVAVQPPDVE
jgi:hypothetical protein